MPEEYGQESPSEENPFLQLEGDDNEQRSLFQKIGDAGVRRYGNENARVIYEELALSAASKLLYQTHGAKENKVPMLRHALLFGESETFKSQMITDFMEHLLPDLLLTGEIDYATPRSLVGSIERASGNIYAPALTSKDFTLVEWDTLSTMDLSAEIKGIFYKALEDGILRNDMVSTAKADTDEGEVYGGTLGEDVSVDNFSLEFGVNSVILGVVHLESEFWSDYDKAFYNRWLPMFHDPPESYIGDARENADILDKDEEEIQDEFRTLFQEEFTTAFKSVAPEAYRHIFREHLGRSSPRLFNKMNVTTSCKALLEGHYADGEVNPTKEDEDWLLERMKTVYGPHVNEMWSHADTNTTNTKRRNKKLESQKKILQYIGENDGATKQEICRAINRPEGTVERWLSERDELFEEWLTMTTEETENGLVKPVYRVDLEGGGT